VKLVKSRNGVEGRTDGHVERLEILTVAFPFAREKPRSLGELETLCGDVEVSFRTLSY
jgi:hypothetical protein